MSSHASGPTTTRPEAPRWPGGWRGALARFLSHATEGQGWKDSETSKFLIAFMALLCAAAFAVWGASCSDASRAAADYRQLRTRDLELRLESRNETQQEVARHFSGALSRLYEYKRLERVMWDVAALASAGDDEIDNSRRAAKTAHESYVENWTPDALAGIVLTGWQDETVEREVQRIMELTREFEQLAPSGELDCPGCEAEHPPDQARPPCMDCLNERLNGGFRKLLTEMSTRWLSPEDLLREDLVLDGGRARWQWAIGLFAFISGSAATLVGVLVVLHPYRSMGPGDPCPPRAGGEGQIR